MAAKKQIADLHARLTADVTQYDTEMRKAAAVTARTNAQVNTSFASMKKGGVQFATALASVSIAATLMKSHIQGVIQNIDKIPGINPEVVTTINSAKAGMASFKGEIDRATASLLSLAVKAGQGIGLGIGALFYGNDAARDAMKQMQEDGRNFYKTQPQYVEALKKATDDLAAAETRLQNVGESKGEGTDRKMREALAARDAALAIKDELQQRTALAAAYNAEASAAGEMLALDDKMNEARTKAGQALAPMIGASLKGKDSINAMRESIARLQYEIAHLDTQTASGMDAATKKWTEMGVLADNLNKATQKSGEFAREMGFAFSSAFEDAILEAGKLSDIVNGLIKDIARMAIRSAITAPLGNYIGGMFSGIFGGGKATGGPVSGGTTYMVGEKGPELFTPSGSGNITPNHKLSSSGGGDNIALTYNIGSGVTASQLMPILAMHKRDIIGTLADAKRRRTPMGAAMA